jgi:hypothetical protein
MAARLFEMTQNLFGFVCFLEHVRELDRAFLAQSRE